MLVVPACIGDLVWTGSRYGAEGVLIVIVGKEGKKTVYAYDPLK